MNRRSIALTIAIVVLLAGGTGGTLAALLRHEPAFYARSAMPEGPQRTKSSGEFVGEFARLLFGISDKRQWDARFTEEQLNSYFQEDFLKEHPNDQPLPEGIRDPRVALEPDKLRVGFRYGPPTWSTIVSIDLRVWLVAKEPNVVALEFQGVHAGALPISSQSLLECASEAARRHDIDPTWYRHNGHPVLLLRFQAGRSRPTFQVQQFDLHQGMLSISGRSLDTTPQSNSGRQNSAE
ncbi:MAG TPA: hypothetical protein VKU02_15900 [Gemmataceae bacterium]|nr:hypothetical protein [Gemmataceae bacterium]